MARSLGVDSGTSIDPDSLAREWERRRPLVEFVSAQEGHFMLAERDGELVGFGRTCTFGDMEELTELHVAPEHAGQGIGPALLEPDLAGSAHPRAGPGGGGARRVAGPERADGRRHDAGGRSLAHARADRRLPGGALARSPTPPSRPWWCSSPTAPAASGRRWSPTPSATIGPLYTSSSRARARAWPRWTTQGRPSALCWAGMDDAVGPAVGATSQDLVPVVLQALDRVAKTQEPATLSVYCATHSWWLLRRLRSLGFEIVWPIWVMSSVPLPGLDRYLPTRPAHVL